MSTSKRSLEIEAYVIIALFSLMVLILGSQVITRYLFSFTFSWAEQLTRIMFVWITFAGISLAAAKSMHLRVSAITMVVPKRWASKVLLFGDSIAVIFGFVMSYRILLVMLDIIEKKQNFPILWGMPTWVMYIPGVLGMLGFSIRLIQTSIWPTISKRKGNEDPAT